MRAGGLVIGPLTRQDLGAGSLPCRLAGLRRARARLRVFVAGAFECTGQFASQHKTGPRPLTRWHGAIIHAVCGSGTGRRLHALPPASAAVGAAAAAAGGLCFRSPAMDLDRPPLTRAAAPPHISRSATGALPSPRRGPIRPRTVLTSALEAWASADPCCRFRTERCRQQLSATSSEPSTHRPPQHRAATLTESAPHMVASMRKRQKPTAATSSATSSDSRAPNASSVTSPSVRSLSSRQNTVLAKMAASDAPRDTASSAFSP
mmetsp:Transcript_10107/g.39362  ORF Transcript_10107/g.39362 Transcript_10107/m.39362 type:complete len:263 (+) Transcript_10107:604-1392(+)